MEKKASKVRIIVIVASIALVAILLGGYCGLCGWVLNNGRLLPGSVSADGNDTASLNLSRMTRGEATAQLEEAVGDDFEHHTLTLRYGDGKTLELTGDLLLFDPEVVVDYGMSAKASQPFLKLGVMWLGLWREKISLPQYPVTFTEEGEEKARQMIQRMADELYVPPVDFTYELIDEAMEVTLGTDGEQVNTDTVMEAALEALAAGQEELTITTEPAPSAELTGDILSELVYTEPQTPALREDGTITPLVVGVRMDAKEAQKILDTVGPGESCLIPVTLTRPSLDGTEDFLYQDLLASCVSYMDGVANRSFNVNRTAEFCNNTIIMPGEVFSYLGAIGDPSVSNGYRTSTGYRGGLTVEMEGGGACQVSSALYYCTVYANLEIVQRANHAFSVGYLPNGLDATVYYPTLDFKFRNNTDYPIKIVSYTTGGASGKVTVQIYGTKTDDTYVIPERRTLSTIPWQTVYVADASIPRNTTKVDVTPYTGYVVETYRCVYSGDGTLISRTFENKSTYAKRDKVILYNPADAAALGLIDSLPAPSETPTPPVETPPPAETTPPPAETPPPVETVPPVETPPPVTDPPAVSEPPAETDPSDEAVYPAQDSGQPNAETGG